MIGWEQFPSMLVGAGFTILIKLAYDGSKWGKKNGKALNNNKDKDYVPRSECQTNVKQMTDSIDLLHKKTNKANEGIAYIKGKLENN